MDTPDEYLGPTIERLRRAGQDVSEFTTETGRKAIRLMDGSVLDKLLGRGALSGDQYNAGIRLRTDWEQANIERVGAIDATRIKVDGGQVEHVTAKSLDALTRWKNAMKAMGGMHARALSEMVLHDMTTHDYGFRFHRRKDRKDASLAGIISLQNALTELDLYYYGRRDTRMASHHEGDWRPEIMPAEAAAAS